jgi:crossover junction endodeoxyribonuclease RuvC
MLLIAGIDPGLTGAVAIYDRDADKLIGVWDIPTVKELISGRQRRRLDMAKLRELFDLVAMFGVALIGIEKVQGWGGEDQSASAAFQFGYVFAKIESEAERIAPVVNARPDLWKMREKVPNDSAAIVKMAIEAFPGVDRFYGSKGGLLHDRAEAALLARYFARRVWPMWSTKGSIDDLEVVDTGKLAAITKKPAKPKGKRGKRKTK